MVNTPAYYKTLYITDQKSFITLAPGVFVSVNYIYPKL
jgi:hypothetical protein